MLRILVMPSHLQFTLPAQHIRSFLMKNKKPPASAQISSVCPLAWRISKIFSGTSTRRLTNDEFRLMNEEQTCRTTQLILGIEPRYMRYVSLSCFRLCRKVERRKLLENKSFVAELQLEHNIGKPVEQNLQQIL